MEKIYEAPVTEVVRYTTDDIITSSACMPVDFLGTNITSTEDSRYEIAYNSWVRCGGLTGIITEY